MATFSIYQDKENNSSILPNKLKDAGPTQKRIVLKVLDKNSDDGNEIKLPIHKNIAQKSTAAIKAKDETYNFHNEKIQVNCKISHKSKVVKSGYQNVQPSGKDFKIFQEISGDVPSKGPCNEKVAIKDENKSRALKDKYVEQEKPTSSKDVSFPSCVTTVHREPSVSSSSSSCMSVQEQFCETDDVIQEMPMSIDNSKISSNLELEYDSRLNELSMNEQLYACDEPKKNYMLKQPDISYGMRAILVDWLVEVVEEYHMKTETLYLAVSYIDRFLSYMSVIRAKLQLVGTAAMFIASKFEEIYPPNVNDFVFITDDTYSKKQVLRMEHLILKVLSFDLSTPTILCFLTDFASCYPTVEKVKFLAMYLCELTLLEADPYLAYLPSEIAASALCVARYTLLDETEEIFPVKLQEVVDHHVEDLIDCISAVDNTFRKASSIPQKAIQEKYKSNK
ncbi:G2/mitotic-specific cyclin-A, putative [Pediculus humanus corporis]|uniref:G2/mitotic-specific cyclin-A, putative n=1 Tax=Pediculus humanus subsp. corporis TaxID=121224 RepID=E0V987_PEDHC|nr:G2/mitotic-specific cyclin-A, putative [Pediculus humanus corporis]EEB09943.1 G2/mitotic-specific cyclin-A, putative [Pediculus humanus corporis]